MHLDGLRDVIASFGWPCGVALCVTAACVASLAVRSHAPLDQQGVGEHPQKQPKCQRKSQEAGQKSRRTRREEKRPDCDPPVETTLNVEVLTMSSTTEVQPKAQMDTGHMVAEYISHIGIDETKLNEEQRRTYLKVLKKLREIAQLEQRIANGLPVEANQQVKVSSRPAIIAELEDLAVAVGFGVDNSFVEVTSGACPSKLRAEAARRAGAIPSHLAAPPAIAVTEGTTAEPKRHKKKKKKGAGAKVDDDDEGGWIEVAKPKKKPISEEERADRHAAQVYRESQRVQNTSTVEFERTRATLKTFRLLDESAVQHVEDLINKVVVDAEHGLLKKKSVDLTPMRNKYFFGFAYTYGAQKEHPGAHGVEAVWPPSETEPIPEWISELVIKPLEKRGVVPKGWINSATINDYAAGGCIVSHIDPPHLFDRPIIGVNFFSDCNLVFGTTFSFPKDASDITCSTPVYVHPCQCGYATVMKGYSANDITHAIRPCDLPSRRASIILRRVLPSAPVLLKGTMVPLSKLPAEFKEAS
mmetsp:Transcript_101695/g.286713  ORF Transcript_101695/g.286713 Transcript_101695/m.286713 type:complete len:528 (-) Transcript_101695:168-1751(-)